MKKLLLLLLIVLANIFFNGCDEVEETSSVFSLSANPNPPEGGTIYPSSGEFIEGTEVSLSVTPSAYYEFIDWNGSLNSSTVPITIIMDSDKNIVGNFKLMDSDGDGVTDDIDQCTETKAGVQVNENGCN